jgi:UDP-2,3-diacylglucosamine pyrophosphatase LpxH
MIIIVDAHISEARSNFASFYKMLELLGDSAQDIVFLGDIFDLWLALPRYETDIHRQFLAWCRNQKNHRSIGFIEGNHEFFLAEERHENFTWCSPGPWTLDSRGNLFVHGDLINHSDKRYLLLRKLTKNRITKFIFRRLPFGPRIAPMFKRKFEKTNATFRKYLPEDKIKEFAETQFTNGVQTIFMGHFHQDYYYRNSESRELYVLPDWHSTHKVTLYEPDSSKITSIHWKQLSQIPTL